MKTSTVLIALLAFFLLTTPTVIAFDGPWRTGQLIRWDNTALTGELSYNWSAEIVTLRQADGRIQAFSAHRVLRFDWFDADTHRLRKFVSLTDQARPDRDHRAFYEVCLEGELTVVRRLRRPRGLLKKAFSHPKHYADQPKLHLDCSHFDYYVHDDGQFRAFNQFYMAIYQPLMLSQDQALRRYVTDHNVNERTTLGQLVLVDRYNAMTHYNTRTASARPASSYPN